MGRIKGHYEWDDDDLTPSQKKEGGLHQNLFDNHGNLKGSARFIPDDRTDPEPLVITETVYVPIEQRRRSREQEEFDEAIAAIVSHLIDRDIARARPLVAQWYRDTARPVLGAQRAKIAERSITSTGAEGGHGGRRIRCRAQDRTCGGAGRGSPEHVEGRSAGPIHGRWLPGHTAMSRCAL